ncbi:hypothetical protein [Roseovarius sp. SYSU LYC5161]|uniref:hypothetical protein n=1 Tax=Roseovarius halophilus (ex Wu et al. 2025) TaxID=3376060 RepID=UPI00399B3BE1
MSREYEIGMLWVEGPLSYIEGLCAKSFVDAGHAVKLYHYGEVSNVPDGVECVHGNEILQIDRFIRHGRTGSFALFSDVFRYHLLAKRDRVIWADLDAYCRRPFHSDTGHFFGWESPRHINGGVLGLPRDSEALGALLEMTRDEYGIPEWFRPEERDALARLRDAGTPMHVSEMDWGVWGPHALTHYLHKTGEARHALPREVLYPVGFGDRRKLVRAAGHDKIAAQVRPETVSIHFYGRRIKRFIGNHGGVPEPGSYLDALLRQHGMAPEPVIDKPAPLPAPAKKRRAVAMVEETGAAVAAQASPAVASAPTPVANPLTALADRYGSDKGSAKHRYTELYHMLFNPFRRRRIGFLEMGLLIGGPEHGESADRPTVDLPSVRMWLDYFPKARVHGLDVSDFSWFEHERFTFHRCDMGDRSQIARAVAGIDPAPMIVVDDASHASHHQQNAFLEVFPKMPSGGLYVIEDLRWQPKTYEQAGITKTADLFRSYLDTRRFAHSDSGVAAEFDALIPAIAGCMLVPAFYQKGRKDQVAVVHKL